MPAARLSLALSVAGGAALAAFVWWSGLMSPQFIADWNERLVGARGGPAAGLAVALAALIGATMVVMPCGYPAVFAVPTALEGATGTRSRLAALLAFAAGGALPLAVAGAALGLAGEGLWELMGDASTRKVFAAVAYPLLGVIALLYALTEFEVLHLQGAFVRLAGPATGGAEAPGRRAFMLGATFGAGMGFACPMPTYYALIGWTVVAGSPAYGAAVLGAYGLGRVLPPMAVGLLVVAGASRRDVSARLVAARARVQLASGVVMAALGAFMITLFGGFLGSSLL